MCRILDVFNLWKNQWCANRGTIGRGQICIKIIQKYSSSKALCTGFVHLNGGEVTAKIPLRRPGWLFPWFLGSGSLLSVVLLWSLMRAGTGLIRNGSSCMVGQTGSIHLLEVILVWEFLATRKKQIFVVLWGCQAFLNLSFAFRNLCLGFLHFPCSGSFSPKQASCVLCCWIVKIWTGLHFQMQKKPKIR